MIDRAIMSLSKAASGNKETESALDFLCNHLKRLENKQRTEIAAMALQGYLANPDSSGSPESYAKSCILYADALIKALNESEVTG